MISELSALKVKSVVMRLSVGVNTILITNNKLLFIYIFIFFYISRTVQMIPVLVGHRPNENIYKQRRCSFLRDIPRLIPVITNSRNETPPNSLTCRPSYITYIPTKYHSNNENVSTENMKLVASLNVQSARNKTDDIRELLDEKKH